MRTPLLPLAALLAAACATAPEGPRAPPPAPSAAAAAAGCARGFAADCRTAGRAALLGEGVPRDDRLAAALLTKACELGDPPACSDVSVLHALGRAVPQSDERASALSRRACELGSAIGCSNEGALLAEGAGLSAAPEQPGRVARLFRTACEGGVPEGCLNLGTALEAGRLAPRDPGGAARAYRRACDAGLGIACHRLALLARDRPETAPGEDPAALDARACAAGVGPACDAATRPSREPGPRAPSARLVEDRASHALGIPGAGGFHPADLTPPAIGPRRTLDDVRRPPAALQAAIPPALRAKLGVEGPARPDDGGDPAMDVLLGLRRAELGGCYAAPRTASGRVEVFATFLVDADGRPALVKAASAPEDAFLEACGREKIAEWEFPVAPGGLAGPFAVGYVFDAAPPGPPPGLAGPGGLRPSLRDPGCVDRHVALPPEHRGALAAATVKLAVGASGTAGLVHALTPVPEPVLAAIAAAVSRCEWAPGADASGRPAPLWTTLTVKLSGR